MYNKAGKNNPNYRDGRTLIKYFCPDCGEQLYSYQSKRCRSCATKRQLKIYTSKRADVSGSKNPMYGIKRFKEDNPMFGRTHKNQTKEIMRTRATGKNNSNWIDGRSYKKYPRKFSKLLKEAIRKRDNYTCQNCNTNEEEHLKKFDRKLEIHHIDYNKKNCKENNLITLCQECNLQANFNRDYWKNIYQSKEIFCD